jgi:hypothetical protein
MDELIGSYVNDTDPLKRAQYWLWSLAWRNGDKSNMLQVLSKEVEAERMKRDALAADNARLRAEVVKLWECERCGFRYDAAHSLDGTDAEYSCPVCNEGKLQSRADAAEGLARALEAVEDWLSHPPVGMSLNEIVNREQELREQVRAALAAYKQAGDKGE